MVFCVKCGKEVPEGSDFCPNCGTQVISSEKPIKSDYSGICGTLILIGGILTIIFSFFPILGFVFVSYRGGMMDRWTGMPHMLGRWGIPMAFVGWIFDFMIIGAIISIILGIFAIYAYMKVRRKEVRTGSTIAIILGIIMLVSMNWLAGLITLIGGILCYTSK